MICIVHPNKHTRAAFEEERVNLPWVEGKSLKMYLREAKLAGLKTGCRADVLNGAGYPERIKTSYVPKDGDIIRLRRVRSM